MLGLIDSVILPLGYAIITYILHFQSCMAECGLRNAVHYSLWAGTSALYGIVKGKVRGSLLRLSQEERFSALTLIISGYSVIRIS